MSKKFRDLCLNAPDDDQDPPEFSICSLLQCVRVELAGPALLPKIRAFSSWLLQRAMPHACTVDVLLPWNSSERLAGADAAEALESLLVAVVACGAAGPLCKLRLIADALECPLRLGSWAAGLTGPSELSIHINGALDVTWPLTALQQLTWLVSLAVAVAALPPPPCAHLPRNRNLHPLALHCCPAGAAWQHRVFSARHYAATWTPSLVA